jgi:hypothetical protein
LASAGSCRPALAASRSGCVVGVLASGWRYARRLHCSWVVTAACCAELPGPADGRSPPRTSARTMLIASRLFANGFANERDEIRRIAPDGLDRRSPETRAPTDWPTLTGSVRSHSQGGGTGSNPVGGAPAIHGGTCRPPLAALAPPGARCVPRCRSGSSQGVVAGRCGLGSRCRSIDAVIRSPAAG